MVGNTVVNSNLLDIAYYNRVKSGQGREATTLSLDLEKGKYIVTALSAHDYTYSWPSHAVTLTGGTYELINEGQDGANVSWFLPVLTQHYIVDITDDTGTFTCVFTPGEVATNRPFSTSINAIKID